MPSITIAPVHLPAAILQRFNREIGEILRSKEVADLFLPAGILPVPSTLDEFIAYIKSELKKWGEVVKLADIKGE